MSLPFPDCRGSSPERVIITSIPVIHIFDWSNGKNNAMRIKLFFLGTYAAGPKTVRHFGPLVLN